MVQKLAVVLVVGMLGAVAYGRPDETGLTGEGEDFLAVLHTAGWSGHASAGGVDVTVRRAPLFSAGMLNAVRNRDALTDTQRADLDDVARVVLPEPGWFFGREVPAGTYRLGLAYEVENPRLVLFDDAGKLVATEAFYITWPSTRIPDGSTRAKDGAVVLTIATGGIELSYRFVPEARHDELTAGLDTIARGKVRIHSDLDASEKLGALAEVATKTLSAHARLLGRDEPDGPFDVYIFEGGDAFDAVDALLTGGEFQEAWAFTSQVTGRSYLRYGPRADRDALADAGLPLVIRSLVLHELHHQVGRRVFAHGTAIWPDWLDEGLAELGAQRALAAASPADGRAYHAHVLGNWRRADRTGTTPLLEDFAGGFMDAGRTGFYTTAYLLAREMARKPKRLHELLDAVSEEPVAPQAADRARDAFARLYGPLGAFVERAAAAARAAKDPLPAIPAGYVDRVDGGWRIVSVPGRAARLVLPEPVPGRDVVTVLTTFSYHPSGQQQTDVYVALREGRHTRSFLKVAVLPKRILLWWFLHGKWRTCGMADYDTPLQVGTTAKRIWHDLKVTYRVDDRKVRVDTTGDRWAEFDVPGYVPLAGTRVGVGVYDGVAYVRDPVVR